MAEREITTAVDLCDDAGRLNPAAVGWTRSPLHRSNLSGWGRTKRWEYWCVITPTRVIAITASSLDYAGVHGLYLLDRRTGDETRRDLVVPFARGVQLPDRSGGGPVRASGPGLTISIDDSPRATRLHARAADVQLDLVVDRPEGHESLGVVVPWSERRFQYTVKDVARPVHGRLLLEGAVHEVLADDSWAVLDHGRGRWPYASSWNWGAGSGRVDGRVIGLQLGGQWTDGTGTSENAIVVDGRLHKIGDQLQWSHDPTDPMAPWHVRGPHVDVSCTPFHERVADTNLAVVASHTRQCFGHWSGHVLVEGASLSVDGLVGHAEGIKNRW